MGNQYGYDFNLIKLIEDQKHSIQSFAKTTFPQTDAKIVLCYQVIMWQ